MENIINLNIEDSADLRDIFKGKKVGDSMTMKVRAKINEVSPNHISAYVEAVDDRVTFEGEVSEEAKKSPAMEVIK